MPLKHCTRCEEQSGIMDYFFPEIYSLKVQVVDVASGIGIPPCKGVGIKRVAILLG